MSNVTRLSFNRVVIFSATLSVAWYLSFSAGILRGESAISLLSGFDEARINAIFVDDRAQPNVDELAKLIFRVDKLEAASLDGLADKGSKADSLRLGHAIAIKGKVRSFQRVAVPESLAELLEFKQFFRVELENAGYAAEDTDLVAERPNSSRYVYVKQIPAGLKAGDVISAGAVVIELETDDEAFDVFAVAANRLSWTPGELPSVGLSLLADEGVDIAAVSALAQRNRQSLQSPDSDAFYPMLAAASSIASKNAPQTQTVHPSMLLQEPDKWIGDWIQLEVEIVRVTKVAVTEPLRQRQLGRSAYYQLDAIGDLGNVVIELQRPEGAPVRFENRFPVSIVTAELPEFLAQKMRNDQGESMGVQMVSSVVRVNGFFFRLWSYENERMNQGGQGEQIGPLVVASSMTSLEIPGGDPVGVYRIGYIAVGALIIGLALILFWTRSNRLTDAAAHGSRDRLAAADAAWLKDQNSGEDAQNA